VKRIIRGRRKNEAEEDEGEEVDKKENIPVSFLSSLYLMSCVGKG
jgi:hypothetical protein